ncbi:hypothetical protein JANAI61_16320 [Jannaschia sp. AI_61]|nr:MULTISPECIES: hypothetical protein [unclassified Jannaschia]GIT91174.1 hypothetical protein JANAI61_16320 [Jannaschia sp. AI_61]
MFRSFCAALALGLAVLVMPDPAAAQGCSEIKFQRGSFSGEVSGRVSERQPVCFTFGSGAGQQARLQVFGSQNVCFNVRGVADCRDDFTFRTRRQTYVVDVNQLFVGPGFETFTLRLTIR